MKGFMVQAKQILLLFLVGFKEACCFHRIVNLCFRNPSPSSKMLLIRTRQCFILNGLIFLGSIFILNLVIIPIILWILPDRCQPPNLQSSFDACEAIQLYSFLRSLLIEIFHVLWFYPLYVLSFVLSNIWYNDIAKHAKDALTSLDYDGYSKENLEKARERSNSGALAIAMRPTDFRGAVFGLSRQIYSLLFLTFFFIEVLATGFIPYIGKVLNFLLLSWMYAYYCHEYKWNFVDMTMDKRLEIFESNWSFFAGFGSPCVLAIFFFSPLVSYGVLAVLYPLFVLTATSFEAQEVVDSYLSLWGDGRPPKLPVLYTADSFSIWVLQMIIPEGMKDQKDAQKVF